MGLWVFGRLLDGSILIYDRLNNYRLRQGLLYALRMSGNKRQSTESTVAFQLGLISRLLPYRFYFLHPPSYSPIYCMRIHRQSASAGPFSRANVHPSIGKFVVVMLYRNKVPSLQGFFSFSLPLSGHSNDAPCFC